MSKSESWKTWTAVILILLVSGFVAAVWPYLTGLSSGGSGGVPVASETIVITIPPLPFPPLEGGFVIELPSFLAFLLLALVVIVSVMVVGVVLTGVNFLISRLVTKTVDSEKYQTDNAALMESEKNKLATKQEGRAAAASQQNDYTRWAVVATSLAILMFAASLGYLVASAIFPNARIIEQDEIVNIAAVFMVAFVLITLFILLLRINPQKLAAVDETDGSSIPWETITVILLGVIVVGLGVGFLVFINSPI